MKKILALLFAGLFLFASEYGKITGRAVDSETGEPLIGADIIVEGSELGAAANERGEYVILYVPAGTYAVIASYLGYDPFTYTNVVVNADQTTVLNFKLRPTVIQIEGVTSVAVREPIVISQTQSGHNVTSQDLNRLPVTTINQVISLQAGVVQSNLGTHVRGGRADEVTYFVDGIVTKVPQTGGQSLRMNANAVEEVSVVSGGFDAEYGDALSGIINVVTKEGGTKTAGNFRYQTDEMFAVDAVDDLNYGYNHYELALGGPFLVPSRIRYFMSGELMMTDAYIEAYYKVPSPRMDYKGNLRFTYLMPNAKGKVTLSSVYGRDQYVTWGSGSLKYFKNIPMSRTKNYLVSSTFNYMLTAKTLGSAKIGLTHYDRLYGNRDYAWEDSVDQNFYDDYRLRAEHLIDYLKDGLPPKDVICDSVAQYHEEYTNRDVEALRHNPYGWEGMFYTYGDYRVWRYTENNDLQGRLDVTHSIGKIHEFKTGFEYMRYNMSFYDNSLPWVTNPFWDYYQKDPVKFAGYIQDKMDFEGLIARLGLRVDYFRPKAVTFQNPGDFLDPALKSTTFYYKISPRLGFSLPVTDRMKFRFNYGHFYQNPALDDMYGVTDTAVIRVALTRGNSILGNVDLRAQKTVQYEFGLENQITDEIVFGFTTYFKDVYDLTQIREVQALPTSYFQSFNVDYGNIKGFEFSFEKMMSNMWSISANYTLQFAKGTASYAGEWYNDHYSFDIDPPVIDYWLDYDERHLVNATVNIDLPKDFVFIPLQNLSSSLVFNFNSGQPYTPQNLRGENIGDDNSARKPSYWNVDWALSRNIGVGPLSVTIGALISNLFNTKQVIGVYSTTGEPDNHGDAEPLLSQFGSISLTATRYSPQADFNHDGVISPVEFKRTYMAARTDNYNNPFNYNAPFKAQLGVSVGF